MYNWRSVSPIERAKTIQDERERRKNWTDSNNRSNYPTKKAEKAAKPPTVPYIKVGSIVQLHTDSVNHLGEINLGFYEYNSQILNGVKHPLISDRTIKAYEDNERIAEESRQNYLKISKNNSNPNNPKMSTNTASAEGAKTKNDFLVDRRERLVAKREEQRFKRNYFTPSTSLNAPFKTKENLKHTIDRIANYHEASTTLSTRQKSEGKTGWNEKNAHTPFNHSPKYHKTALDKDGKPLLIGWEQRGTKEQLNAEAEISNRVVIENGINKGLIDKPEPPRPNFKDKSYVQQYGYDSNVNSIINDNERAKVTANNDRIVSSYNQRMAEPEAKGFGKQARTSDQLNKKVDSKYQETIRKRITKEMRKAKDEHGNPLSKKERKKRVEEEVKKKVDHRTNQLNEANKNRLQRGAGKYNNEIMKEKFQDIYQSTGNWGKKLLSKLGANSPDHYKDSVTAAMMGVNVRPTAENKALTMMDRVRNTLDPGSVAYTEGAKERTRPYQGYNSISKQSMNIDYLSNFSEKDQEFWKKMHRQETAKYVRRHGGNIDPFDGAMEYDHVKGSVVPNDAVSDPMEKQRPNESFSNKAKDLETKDKARIKEIDNQIKDLKSKNISKWNDLKTGQHSAHYRLQVEQLQAERESLLDPIEKKLVRNPNYIVGPLPEGHLPESQFLTPEHTKTFRPEYGLTGYGLGFKNAMSASNIEHLARAMHYMNPVGAGGGSLLQGVRESFGLMNKAQQMQYQQARGFSKLMHTMVPATALGTMIYSMNQGDDPNEIASTFLGIGFAVHGWRGATALGGALTAPNSLMRAVGMGVGGVLGAGTGYLVGAGLVEGISDAMSNDSHIRKFAKKASTKEQFVSSPDTHQSLTARQASLQKLARSGLNDRGQLLGNEAAILNGIG